MRGCVRVRVGAWVCVYMSNNRVNDLECALERMSVTLENVEEEIRQLRKRVAQLKNWRRSFRDDEDGLDDYESDRREHDASRSYSRTYADRDGDRERDYYDRNRRDREEESLSYARGNGSRDDDEYGRDRRDRYTVRFDERDDCRRRDRH